LSVDAEALAEFVQSQVRESPDLYMRSTIQEGGAYAAALLLRIIRSSSIRVQFLRDPLIEAAGAYRRLEAQHQGQGLGLWLCEHLISHGFDATAISSIGPYGTALIAACAEGSVDVCRLLLEHGADVRQGVSIGIYGTPLIAACHEGRHLEVFTLLLQEGAPVDVVALTGAERTAVFAAINGRGSDENVEFMLQVLSENGVDITSCIEGAFGTRAPLMDATLNLHFGTKTIALLLRRGADPESESVSSAFGHDWDTARGFTGDNKAQ
jgi:ankyrin repeat protein